MKTMPRLVTGAAILATLAGCRHDTSQNSPMELKVYSVPADQTTDLARALNDSLSALKAHASVAMPGRILIYAPHDTQASIGTAIDDLTKSIPGSTASEPPLRVSFWMIDAIPGPGNDDPALAPMRSVLDSLRTAMGPHHFILTESVSGLSSGTMSLIRTAGHDFRFETIRSDQGIRLAVDYANGNSSRRDMTDIDSIQAQMTTQPGQYEVLARTQTNVPDNTILPNGLPPPLHLLVARVDTTHPAK